MLLKVLSFGRDVSPMTGSIQAVGQVKNLQVDGIAYYMTCYTYIFSVLT